MAQQILVIHGGDTFNNYDDYLVDLRDKQITIEDLKAKNWKGSLDEKLEAGFEVLAPRMPNAQNAKYLEWKIWFDKIVPLLNDNVILIGHSLGGIFLAKYLTEEKFPKKVKATFLIAAPHSDETIYSLGDFKLPTTIDGLAKQGGQIFIYHSKDDTVVPFVDFERYQSALSEAQVRIFKNRQHFQQADFPELIEDILKI